MKNDSIKKFQYKQNELFIDCRELRLDSAACVVCGTAAGGVLLTIDFVVLFLIGLANTAINYTLVIYKDKDNLLTSNGWCIS